MLAQSLRAGDQRNLAWSLELLIKLTRAHAQNGTPEGELASVIARIADDVRTNLSNPPHDDEPPTP